MKKISIIFLIGLFLTGCFYDYGVRSDNDNIKYESSARDDNKYYEFYSSLSRNNINTERFAVGIEHLSKIPFTSNRFESKLKIYDRNPNQEKRINFKTLKLIHSRKGKIIKEERIDFRARTLPPKYPEETNEILTTIPNIYTTSTGEGYINIIEYSKIYKFNLKPRKIDEYIFLEYEMNGEIYEIEYEFPLEFKKRETLLSVFIIGSQF